MSERALKYQEHVGGQKGKAYVVNGVRFDAYDDKKNILIDAKDQYNNFVDKNTGRFKPWFQGADDLLDQADRQLEAAAASGTPIEWHFSQKETLEAVKKLFEEKQVSGIKLVYDPMP